MTFGKWVSSLVWLAGGGAGLLALHFGAREAVAAAVVRAPNAARTSVPSLGSIPGVLAERDAYALTTEVGPPAARLVSWVVAPRAEPSKGTIVLLHGVRMDKRSLVPIAVALSDAGYRTVLVDLRGHGESSGRYLTYGFVEARDVSRVLDSLGERESRCVGAYGFSYGASVAILLTARDARLKAVVAVAPFSSLEEVARDYERKYLPIPLSLIPHAWFRDAIDEGGKLAAFDPEGGAPVRLVGRSTADLLLIHGAADDQVPLRHSVMLAEAAGSRAELLTLPHATHEDMPLDSSGAVRRATLAWFDRSLSGDACGH